MIFLVKILRTTTAPTNTLTNTNSFKLTEGTNEGYGQQRVFGSIAFGTGAFIAGYLIDKCGMNSVFYYTYFFNAVTLFFIIYVLPSSTEKAASTVDPLEREELLSSVEDNDSSCRGGGNGANASQGADNDLGLHLRCRSRSDDGMNGVQVLGEFATSPPASSSSSSSSAAPSSSSRFGHFAYQLYTQARAYAVEVYMFLSHATCRAILVNAFLYGMVMTVPDTFLYISLEKDFNASRTYSGIVTTISVLGCIPLFWYSNYYIAKYGHFNIIFFSECTCVIRLFSYALLSPTWPFSLYVLPVVQLIHGLNFALYWSAAVDAIHKLSPKELNTTSMAALNVAYATFGAAVGNLLFGYVYDLSGGVNSVYNFSAILMILTIGLLSGSGSLLSAHHFSQNIHGHAGMSGGSGAGVGLTGVAVLVPSMSPIKAAGATA
jgi:hypothetical protein